MNVLNFIFATPFFAINFDSIFLSFILWLIFK
nr:MAG TPA_asm: hypothetical protein [Caudoviricetes sp.]DAZ65804.1 MAG TPA: hypothetical protein [Caudoviricetes sp.]